LLYRILIGKWFFSRSSLLTDIVDLENDLHRERESHSETKSKLMKLDHEMSMERENRENERVDGSTMTLPCNLAESTTSFPKMEVEELAAELESAKLTISRLEDQVRELEQQVDEVKSESQSQLEVAR